MNGKGTTLPGGIAACWPPEVMSTLLASFRRGLLFKATINSPANHKQEKKRDYRVAVESQLALDTEMD